MQRKSETESYAAQQTTEEVAASQDVTGPSQAHPEDTDRRAKRLISLLLLHVRSPHYTNVYELHGVYSQTLLACTDRL